MTHAGFHGIPDTDFDGELARGCARLPGAEPSSSGPVLRPAASAAAVQAAAHGIRVRQLTFQIAPCFRDEDARADRSPGEFYQLDFEMAFATQDDVFNAIEPVLHGVFDRIQAATARSPTCRFPASPMTRPCSSTAADKPDLRNPIILTDVTEAFRDSGFGLFARNVEKGSVVRAIPAPGAANRPRSFFDKLNDWARAERSAGGLGYIIFRRRRGQGPHRQEPGGRPHPVHPRSHRRRRRRRRVLRLPQEERGRTVRRVRPRSYLRRAGAARDKVTFKFPLDRRLPGLRTQRGQRPNRVQPQSVLHAPGRPRSVGNHGSARDQGVPVRHRLQRRGAFQRRHPEPSARTS